MCFGPFDLFSGNTLDIEHFDPLARQFAADRVPYRLNVRHQGGGGVAYLVDLLSRRAPVRRTPLDVLKLLALESRHADHEEFVEVRSRDRQEAESLEQRVRCVARLLKHAAVECQPRKLAIEKAIAAALAEERIVVVIVEPGEVRGAVHRDRKSVV